MTSMSEPSLYSTPISPVTDPAARPEGGERGVVYVATKDARFVEEAALSAITMKQAAPGLPVWLYTDQAECPLNRLNVFDHVEIIETCTDYEDVSAGAKIDRLRVLTNAPFERFQGSHQRFLARGVDHRLLSGPGGSLTGHDRDP